MVTLLTMISLSTTTHAELNNYATMAVWAMLTIAHSAISLSD